MTRDDDPTFLEIAGLVVWAPFMAVVCWLENRRPYRRLLGGVWERWWVEPCRSDVWHRVPDDPDKRWPACRPSPVCRGTPAVEDWRRA